MPGSGLRSSHGPAPSTRNGTIDPLGAGGPVAVHAAGLARHEQRQRRPADAGRGLRRLLRSGPVDRPRVPARDHDGDRERRTDRRRHRPPPAAGRRHRPLHGRVGGLWGGAHALAADRRPGGPGPRRGDHARPHNGVRRRDGARREDGQRHGAARDDVGDRHGSGPIARRSPGRRAELACDLPRQRTAGRARPASRASSPARRPTGAGGPPGRLRPPGHGAARPHARRVHPRDDPRPRPHRSAQPGPAVGRRRRGRACSPSRRRGPHPR